MAIRATSVTRWRALRWLATPGLRIALVLFALVVLAGLAYGGSILVGIIPSLVQRTANWSRLADEHRTGETAAALFKALVVQDSVISFEPGTGRLVIKVDCGALAAGFGAGDRTSEAGGRIDRLCTTDAGKAIHAEAAVWNRGLRMLAIRDDFRWKGMTFESEKSEKSAATPWGPPCIDDTRRAGPVVSAGCYPNGWDLDLGLRRDDMLVSAGLPEPPAGEVFGFLARPALPGFADWERIDTGALGDRPARLVATLRAPTEATTLTIDVIGRAPVLTIGGSPGPAPRLLCHGARTPEKCQTLMQVKPLTPHAWRFSVALPARRDRDMVKLVIKSAAVPLSPVEIAELGQFNPVRRPGDGDRRTLPIRPDESIRLTRSMSLVCQVFEAEDYGSDDAVKPFARPKATVGAPNASRRPAESRYCEPEWNVVLAGRREERGAVTLVAAGGREPVTLARPEVVGKETVGTVEKDKIASVATETTRALGLVQLTGHDESDRYSLIGQAVRLTSKDERKTLELTVDPALQTLVLEQVRDLVRPNGPAASAFAPGHVSERRAALVLIDAGSVFGGHDERAGRILAATTMPDVRAGLSQWDLLAADSYRPAESPLAARAWSQNDRHFAPGSTFKALVALAAVDRAARLERIDQAGGKDDANTRIRRALGLDRGQNGGLTAGELTAVFGRQYGFAYDADTLDVPVRDGGGDDAHEIGNVGGSALCGMTLPRCAPGGRIGLRRALATSSNIWFSRMALLLDDAKVMSTTGPGGQRRELRTTSEARLTLDRVLSRVWPKERIDLVPGFEEVFGRPPVPGSRSYATPIMLDALLPDRPRRLSLALNGIGQATQATPVAMASIMASIATGKIVRPRLTPQPIRVPADRGDKAWPGDDVIEPDVPTEGGKADFGEVTTLMNGLRAGLKDVVTGAGGTAVEAFQRAPYRERLYGKTGTAETGDGNSSTNSVWFVGWVDGIGGNAGNERRIAFACVVTHLSRSSDQAYGGRVCAPAVERVLTRLHGNATPTAARP